MSEYIFSSQEKESEYKRLCLIQDSFDEKSQKHLLHSGLQKGMNVLEVGMGAGSLASWMSEIVEAEGSVLGVDLNTDYALDQNSYEIREGDILELDISKSFDLIHLRYVLIHNLKAKEILQKFYTLLKPGGKLVVEEPDFSLAKWIDAKDLEGCKRVNSAICKMFENKGLKPYYGSVAHLSLQELGFEIKDSKSYLHLCSGGEDISRVMELSTSALEEEYIQTGLCSKEDIQAYLQACKDKESLAVYYATIALMVVKPMEVIKKEEPFLDEPIALLKVSKVCQDGINLAQSDDEIQRCFALMQELRPHLDEEAFVSQIQGQIKEGYQLFYLCKSDEVPCLAGCRISTNLAWGKHLYIDDLISSETQRSKGLGKEMLEYLIDLAKSEGCEEIHLDSGVQRFLAHKFYLREGFRIASHHFTYKVDI